MAPELRFLVSFADPLRLKVREYLWPKLVTAKFLALLEYETAGLLVYINVDF